MSVVGLDSLPARGQGWDAVGPVQCYDDVGSNGRAALDATQLMPSPSRPGYLQCFPHTFVTGYASGWPLGRPSLYYMAQGFL